MAHNDSVGGSAERDDSRGDDNSRARRRGAARRKAPWAAKASGPQAPKGPAHQHVGPGGRQSTGKPRARQGATTVSLSDPDAGKNKRPSGISLSSGGVGISA